MNNDPSQNEFPSGFSDREFLLGVESETVPRGLPDAKQSLDVRLKVIGLLLTFVGGMALFLSAVNLGDSILNYRDPGRMANQVSELKKMFPEDETISQAIDQMVEWNKTPFFIGYAVICVVISMLILFGGWRVQQRRGYPLAITSAVLVMLPVNLTCCVGIPIGIWALVVLLQDDVRKSFRP